ncbi:MAG: sodium:proton antiporter NhaD [Candidatus Gracilibacteria bacterium]|nr:sodium:proton antiporter NhaD [Candidatus Gracilibacteria bacterium]
MFKFIMLLFLLPLSAFASGGMVDEIPNLSMTWVGILCLIIFVVCYAIIALEDQIHIDKAKPALFMGTIMFILIAFYYAINHFNMDIVHTQSEHVIFEIAEIFFFLYVAMIYIESIIHMGIFDKLKYNLISKGYTYRQLFWITGFMSFFISPLADNLTTALILSTVLYTIEKEKREFIVPSAINIVVASNAGGAWSPFGDITTLMVWTSGKGNFLDFLYLFPSSFLGYFVTAFLLSKVVPNTSPSFSHEEKEPVVLEGADVVIKLGIFTIISAIISHQVLNLPPMWGMMFGLSMLKLYSFNLTKRKGKDHFNVFHAISKIENNTLLFLFGILAAVASLNFLGWLSLLVVVYEPSYLGNTLSNVSVGFISAIIDNVPVMSAILKANPHMDLSQWMLVTLTAGVGGSLISFGSAAGVGVMGKLKDIYTFSSHMRYSWMILVGYFVSIAVWYFQYQVLSIGIGRIKNGWK